MKLFTSFLFFILLVFFVGCSNKCEPIERIVLKEVNIPVKPTRPNIECDFEGDGLEPTQKLLNCLILHKRIIEEITTEDHSL